MVRPLARADAAAPASPSRRRLLRAAAALSALPVVGACGGGGSDGPGATEHPAALDVREAVLQVSAPRRRLVAAAVRDAARAAVARGLAGAVYGQLEGDELHTAAAGVRRVDTRVPLDGHEHFALGSNGKAMTALLAAQQVARGRLRWDSRVLELLPEAAEGALDVYRDVTLEQLLAHRGGIRAFTGAEDLQDFAQRYDGPIPAAMHAKRVAFAAWLLRQPPREGVTPGETFFYSNAGYTIASAMLEAAAGRRYEAQLRQLVEQPLGLELAWVQPDRLGTDQPAGHEGAAGTLTPLPPAEPDLQQLDDVMAAAGTSSCTPATYACWLRRHLQALRGQATPLPSDYVAKLRALGEGDYALGWMRVPAHGRAVLAHLGSADGFTSFAMLDQAGERATFALTNTGGYDGDPWVSTVLQTQVLRLDARVTGS